MIRELLRAEAYAHPVPAVDLRETHISWVLLAGEFAYKIKKPLDLGFLDFSTIERRSKACSDELRLNRRMAPDLYLGVVDVVMRDGSAHVGGPGHVIDRAVWMRRLPEEGMLPANLEQGRVTATHLRRLARQLVDFHQRAATGPGVDQHGSLQAVEANWAQNFEEMAPFVSEVLPAWMFEQIRGHVSAWLITHGKTIERRRSDGRVRDGHGDLHAGNLCLIGDQIRAFDCLEFSARYRCSDVAAEVAFLAMDLEQAGRPDLAWHFSTHYARLARDAQLLGLLPFYKSYRAFVRGKVHALRLRQAGLRDEDREELSGRARGCFELALRYLREETPDLLAMCGLPASGKSSLARELSQRQGMLVISTDVVRKRLAGYQPTTPATADFGAGIYGPAMTRRTYRELRRQASRWLRRGVRVILDGTFGDPRQRHLARDLARRTNARFQLVLVTSPDAEWRRRLLQREGSLSRVSDAGLEIAQQLRAEFVEPAELDPGEVVADSTGGRGADSLIQGWYRDGATRARQADPQTAA